MTDRSATPNDPQPSHDPSGAGPNGASARAGGATAIMDSLRDAIDDIAVRATPAVREVSARAAELTAEVAAKAAPLAKKAGDATAGASDKLAERSKTWAAGVRAAMDSDAPKMETSEAPSGWGTPPTGDAPTGDAPTGDASSGPAPTGESPATDH